MNIFIINHSVENCGVYQYGKRFGNIASKSKKYNFKYYELNSEVDLNLLYDRHKPEAIIYNYLGGTMPWVTEELVQRYRNLGVKQYLIVHNVGYATFFDYYLHQHPYYEHVDANNFALARPLFDYQSPEIEKDDSVLHVGSFGFGFRVKHFDQICRIVNEQLSYRKVQINLHLTSSHFCPNANDITSIKQDCLNAITHDNIKLNMTHDFLTDDEMLNFLYRNDLNIFFYQNYGGYNGISSTVDYALSVKKPLAICRSNMFAHIWDVQPSICVETNSLLNIINNGFTPLEEKYNSWTNEKFIHTLETIMEKTFEV
ncbi:glycosyltransferase family 4 protein [Synechococcus phage DSL-LC02]|nr:glycosyltransferase family 4 protein [Synechococcus phage DSL-LC02]